MGSWGTKTVMLTLKDWSTSGWHPEQRCLWNSADDQGGIPFFKSLNLTCTSRFAQMLIQYSFRCFTQIHLFFLYKYSLGISVFILFMSKSACSKETGTQSSAAELFWCMSTVPEHYTSLQEMHKELKTVRSSVAICLLDSKGLKQGAKMTDQPKRD